MSNIFAGFVLKKPKVAPSNSSLTSDPDTIVLERDSQGNGNIDRDLYLDSFIDEENPEKFEYLVTPAKTGNLVETNPNDRLSLFYTKNDDITRFGFDTSKNRWAPLPGSKPEVLGEMPSDGKLQILALEPDLGDPRILIGDLSGQPVPVEWVTETQWPPASIPIGEAVANSDTGELHFHTTLASDNKGVPVYHFRKNFFDDDNITGFIGVEGEDELFLNPIPVAGERPLIRSKYRSYIDPNNKWDPVSGHLNLNDPNLEGEPIYYDGVYSIEDPILPFGPDNLGEITKSFIGTSDTFIADGDKYPDNKGIILYTDTSGISIEEIHFIEENESFSQPFELQENTAEAKRIGSTIEIQLSFSFRSKYEGENLEITSGDFYIEKGITFRMFPSLVDPTYEKGIPDAQFEIEVDNETVNNSINGGSFSVLNQIPLQDSTGFGVNEFFQLQKGVRTTRLIPNENIVYDFDNNQIKWAERVTDEAYDIREDVLSVKLKKEALLNKNFEFSLDNGEGFEELEPGEDLLIDFDSGLVSFAEPKGTLLYQGVGSFIAGEDTFESINTVFSLDSTDQALLIIDSQVFKILSSNNKELTVHTSFESSETGVPFQVISKPENIFKYSLRDLNLTKRWVFPRIITNIETANPSIPAEYVPAGEDFYFLQEGDIVPHVVLNSVELGSLEDSLELPVVDSTNENSFEDYYKEDNFKLMREAKVLTKTQNSSPSPDEFFVEVTGDLTFNNDDIIDYPNAIITLIPELSGSDHPAQQIEVLGADRSFRIPDALENSDLEVSTLLLESQYLIQKNSGQIFFDTPFREGSRLEVDYFVSEEDFKTGNITTEKIGFQIREEVSLGPNQTSISFGSGVEVDSQRPVTFLVNGAPVNSNANIPNKTITFPPVKSNRATHISYYGIKSKGGEKIAALLNPPFSPDIIVKEGHEQVFFGDHRDVLEGNTILLVDNKFFVINENVNITYDPATKTTKFEIVQAIPTDIENPSKVQGTTAPIPLSEGIPLQVVLDKTSKGSEEVRIFGDHSQDVKLDHILFLDLDPYGIDSVSFDEEKGFTSIITKNELLRDYSNPNIRISDEPVYNPEPDILQTKTLPFTDEPIFLIRFGDLESIGNLLQANVDYRTLNTGSIVLDPTSVDTLPQAGDNWFLGYLGRRVVGPNRVGARKINPVLKTSYTKFINASYQNQIQGSKLKAKYTFRSPDSFYFRALPLEDYAVEVASQIDQNTNSLSSSSGPTISFGGTQELQDKGSVTLIGEGGDLKDQDRVGRRFISFYNQVAQLLESYLQVLDGRLVGDRSGQFRFFLGQDGEKGGEDPVTGDLIDYYVNPDGSGDKLIPDDIKGLDLTSQESLVRNSIDDIVTTSKKPMEIEFPLPFSVNFVGTFQKAWEPHRLSRFYPQKSNIKTITPPTLNENNSEIYTFRKDFKELLGDLQHENIISIENISDRSARGWISEDQGEIIGNTVKVKVGMSFQLGESASKNINTAGQEINLVEGDAARLIPGFKVGTLVNLGRNEFIKNAVTGIVKRNENIYASNMVITEVTGDYITLEKASFSTLDTIFNQEANFFDNYFTEEGLLLDDFVTDPVTILSEIRKNDTIFVQSTNYYGDRDYGLDASEGELVNKKLPPFLSVILGQNAPTPLTPLDITLTYKNQRTSPFRFPALDGKPYDDDGLLGVPYSYPIEDSEALSFGAEIRVTDEVLDKTAPGIVENTIVFNSYTLQFPFNLEDPLTVPVSPKTYDLILLENIKTGNDSSPFFVSNIESNLLFLKSFEFQEKNLSYQIEKAFNSEGTRTSTTIWTDDFSQDFTGLSGLNGTLVIGTSSYTIATFGNGFLETTTNIAETGDPYYLNLEGIGNIEELHRFQDTSVNFGLLAEDAELTLTSSINTDIYLIAHGDADGNVFVKALPSSLGSEVVAGISVNSALYKGIGSRDVGNSKIWLDASQNFAVWEGKDLRPYLHIISYKSSPNEDEIDQVSTYEVAVLRNGEIETIEPISESVTNLNYILSTTSSYAKHTASSLQGSAVLTLDGTSTTSLSDLNLEIGNTLIIPQTNSNGGNYKVEALNFVDGEITVDRPLQETFTDYVVPWSTYQPRRFSSSITQLRDTLLQRRVIYQDIEDTENAVIKNLLESGQFETGNPSTPSLNILKGLLDVLFGDSIVESSDGEFLLDNGTQVLKSNSFDFTGLDVLNSYYLQVHNGDSIGFYRLTNIRASDEVGIKEGSEFPIGTFTEETDLSFTLLEASLFSERSYELVLYEYYNILKVLDQLDSGILSMLHNPEKLIFSDLIVGMDIRAGDPTNSFLVFLLDENEERKEWIVGVSPTIIDEINGVLKGSENLYNLRFAWIDFRINLESGTLPSLKRFKSEKTKRKNKLVKMLLKSESTS